MADFEYPAGAKVAGRADISQVSGLTDDECQELLRQTIPFGSDAVDVGGLNAITLATASKLWPSVARIEMGPDGIDVSVIHTGNN